MPESTHLVDVSSVLLVGNLVASRLGILLDDPLLPLRVDDIPLSLEHGIVPYPVGCRLCIGEVFSVHAYEVLSVLDALYGEGIQCVGKLLLVSLDQPGTILVHPGRDDIAAHHGFGLHDAPLIVTARDGLYLLLNGRLCTVVTDELHRVLPLQGILHHHHLYATLSQETHALHPGSYLAQHLGLVHAVGQEGIGCRTESGEIHEGRMSRLEELRTLSFSTQSVSRLAQVHVVLAEEAESLLAGGHEVVHGPPPALGSIILRHVPRIVSNAVETHLGSLGIFHGVGAESAHHVVDVETIAVGLAHEEPALAVVVDGIVEPDKCLALYLVINPLHVVFLNHIHHAVARPHDAYLGVHLRAQGRQVLLAGPALVVFCGTHDERLHVLVAAYELVRHVVEQSCLLVALGTLSPDVIEEDRKGADAQRVHLLQLVDHGHGVLQIPAYVATWVYGPYELHLVAVSRFHQFL